MASARSGLIIACFSAVCRCPSRRGKAACSPGFSWKEIVAALLLLAIFWAAGLSGWKPLLYPISIMAISGQVILMASLGTMMAAILLRRERRVSNLTELAPLILIGLIAVVAILGANSAARYALFGPGPIPAWR
jgi:hypothetical protein